MKDKLRSSYVYKRIFRLLLIVILIFGLAQFAANFISLGANRASAASDPVIAAAGDIACDPVDGSFNNGNGTSSLCRQLATSDLLVNAGFDAILVLGDNQYECGSSQAFLGSYDLSWGRVKSITHPAAGNHEYQTTGATDCDSTNAGAAGYYSYFGAAAGLPGQGYYSFDIGAWHLISLNTQCSQVGGCGTSSPQYQWLQNDLAAHPNQCLLAYWHIPLFSSYPDAAANSQPFWNLLYNAHADLILNGHSHTYERFGQQNPSGGADPNGIRQIIVGTGGKSHYSITSTAANSEVQNTSTYGVLKLSLHSSSYDWQFLPIAGQTFTDSGSNSCHFTGLVPTYTPTDTSTPTSTGTLAQTDTFTSTSTGTSAQTDTLTSTSTSAGTPAATDTVTFTPTTGATATATSAQTPSFTPTASGGNQTVATPAADAYVDSANPANNYGTGTTIRVDASPVVNTYIRYNVSGVSGTVTHASLSLYANSSGTQGIRVYSVTDNTWGETSLTYNNAPPLGSLLASSGPFASGARVTLDLSGYITGNGAYSLAVTDLSSTAISLASRESGANAPQLILSLGSGSSSTPTNTPNPSNTPTITPTFTETLSPTNTPVSTNTSTPTPGITIIPTYTATRTNTPTETTANTATPSNTPMWTNTSTPTPGISPTFTYTPTSTATSSSQVHTFTPVADAYVDSSRPTANFGTGTFIQVDGSPINNGYIKFNVAGLSGTITKVTIRLYANSSASSGIKAMRVADSTWGETTITYNNAPPLGSVLATSAAFPSKTWVTLDVTGSITGNGTYSFGITISSTRSVRLASRESGVNAAQLIIETH